MIDGSHTNREAIIACDAESTAGSNTFLYASAVVLAVWQYLRAATCYMFTMR